MDEQDAWLDVVRSAGRHLSGVIDRFWFRSIYFREPSGVRSDRMTLGPGSQSMRTPIISARR
jgi:glyoxalase family protein